MIKLLFKIIDRMNQTLHWCLFYLCLSVIVLSAKPCLSKENQNLTDNRSETVTLQLKWKHQFQFAGYYAALEKGFYRNAGLDVKIIEAKDGEESTGRVFSGEADFGIAMSDLILLRAKGYPVVALASIFQHSPLIVLVPKKSKIVNIHALKGRRIALEAHSEELLAYFESEGVPSDKMIILPHEYSISNLISGRVDAMSAYSTDEPFMLLKQGIAYSTFSPRSGGIDFYGDTLFTSEDQVHDHPERVSAFLTASLKGWQYALENSEEIIDLILSKYTKRHSREHLLFEAKMSKQLIMFDMVEIGYVNPGRWRHISNTYKKLNIIPNEFSLEGFIYDRSPILDFRWLYLSLSGAILTAFLFLFISGRFYKLNQSLKKEMLRRREIEIVREQLVSNLQEAIKEIKTLRGILPICSYCKKIRDDKGYWNQIEEYLHEHSDAKFSHGICKECADKYYPDMDLYDDES
jgi:ABC-type nitrate/sulfonate/bicarbonate transport system substrate-binding protein